MNTIKLLKAACVIVLPVLLVLSCGNEKSNTLEQTTMPNIVYILADDLGYGDLSCYGQNKFSTPNIDRLAKEGMLFTQHYSGSTVCAPSRSALMTGQHTGHTYIRGNRVTGKSEYTFHEGQYPLAAEERTIAEVLKEKGYVTGAFGKWGLGFPRSPGDPTNQGFDQFFGYNCQALAHHYYPYHLWENLDSIPLEENYGKEKEIYAPYLIQEKTIEFIESHKDKPFFLFVPNVIPHAELVAPEEVMDRHRGKYDPEKVYEGYDDGPKYRQGPYESQKESHAAFAAMIEILDHQVGEILDKLEELGLSDNTLVVFTSDNGPHLEGGADPDFFDSNGPLRGYKRDLYEGGIRVPMLAKWPGKIKSGSSTPHISAFWDVFPTVCDIIGAEKPTNLDGISFLPTLLGEGDQEQHSHLYWEFHEMKGRVAIRKDNWKLIKYNVLNGGTYQLYDLSNDLEEQNDLASEMPEKVKELEGLLKASRRPSPLYKFEL